MIQSMKLKQKQEDNTSGQENEQRLTKKMTIKLDVARNEYAKHTKGRGNVIFYPASTLDLASVTIHVLSQCLLQSGPQFNSDSFQQTAKSKDNTTIKLS